MYAMIATRLDIAYAVSFLSQFSSDPSETHLKSAKYVLRYVKDTVNFSITYKNTDLNPVGFSDADWAVNLSDKKSTSGYIFLITGGAVTWSSKK
jgi:type IV secretory pathway component VirB8